MLNFKQAVVIGIVIGISFTTLGFIGDGSPPNRVERMQHAH